MISLNKWYIAFSDIRDMDMGRPNLRDLGWPTSRVPQRTVRARKPLDRNVLR